MNWNDILKNIEWQEGRKIELPPHSNRYAMTVVCTARGLAEGEFANGAHKYFTVVAIVRYAGSRIYQGTLTVPVLPDGRLLMVVNQRPSLDFFEGGKPRIIETNTGAINLGFYGSFEFPGGVAENEKIKDAFLRELQEETGIDDQEAVMYQRCHPIYPMSAEFVGRMHYAVVYLTSSIFSNYVDNDGGLSVVALTPAEFERNIYSGVIASGHAAILGWNFYQEIEKVRRNPELLQKLENEGYISIEKVIINNKKS